MYIWMLGLAREEGGHEGSTPARRQMDSKPVNHTTDQAWRHSTDDLEPYRGSSSFLNTTVGHELGTWKWMEGSARARMPKFQTP
jgi:hypothetical protein